MKIKELILNGAKILNENEIEDSNIIANVLAQKMFKIDKIQIVINDKEIEESEIIEYNKNIEKIIEGTPLQYITNYQEFMGYEFYVDENVLIPQPDTEILVEEVIEISKKKESIKILDICTGSGCIGISLAKKIENAQVTLSDISIKALEVAKKNTNINNISNRINFIQSDMFENITEKYDIIVSNPPYIETGVIKTLDKTVQNEPHLALDGGEDGLKFYRILIQEGMKYLNDNGYLCLEIGYDQKEKVMELAKGKEVYCKKDLSGNDRVIIIKK